MSTDADLLADRRSLRRKLTLWRVLATLGLIVAIVIGGLAWRGDVGASSPHIARITISGFISGDRRTLDLIKSVEESKAVSAVVLNVNSPGGTTSGAEALHIALRELAAKKPMVTFVSGVAASGGYIAALSTDHIVARETALVGSIGVLFQFPNVSQLLGTLGVKVEEVKSTPLKAAPNGFEPTSPEARAALQSVVDDNYRWFKQMVSDRRRLDTAQLDRAADGRVFSGRQALGLRLIDEMGGEREGIAWMEKEKGVAKELKIRDWRPRSGNSGFSLWSLAEVCARVAGLDGLAASIARAADQPVGLRLDEPLALWQPAAEK